jgi:uncharacterized FlaG/YvyC family protein
LYDKELREILTGLDFDLPPMSLYLETLSESQRKKLYSLCTERLANRLTSNLEKTKALQLPIEEKLKHLQSMKDFIDTILSKRASNELKNILKCKKTYDNDSLDKEDGNVPLYYLRLQSDKEEFDSRICLCQTELIALKTYYSVERNYYTKKVYSLELKPNDITILKEVETTLQEVWNDEKLKENFKHRFSEKLSPYTIKDLKKIASIESELIWDLHSRIPQFVVKTNDGFILPKDALNKKANMPFGLSGGSRVMIDKNGKYGIINTGDSLKDDLKYKLLYPFTYHYIRLDGFGNAELLEYGFYFDSKSKYCPVLMVNLYDETKEPIEVILNSTSNDEYVTMNNDGLLIQHTKNGTSKAYQTIIQSFLENKPVQDTNGFWGYIDKDCNEIIPCQFQDWNFFNDGYAVLEEDGKSFVIDESGKIVVESSYEEIEHYKNDIFFVKTENKWGALKDTKIYVDFIDVDAQVALIKEKNSLKDEEVMDFMLRESAMTMRYLPRSFEPHYLLLSVAIYEKRKVLYDKKFEIPLEQYMKLFDVPKDENDLAEIGVLHKTVLVEECEIVQRYKELLKDPSQGSIGYQHQMGASCYDMSIELPVTFDKIDGSSVSLGIQFAYLTLKRE